MCSRFCRECGAPLDGRDPRTVTCSAVCRKAFHNRRMVRGAELYDLFMNLRYERGAAKALGLWKLMCRMGQTWRDEDARVRADRASYFSAGECRERVAAYAADIVWRGR